MTGKILPISGRISFKRKESESFRRIVSHRTLPGNELVITVSQDIMDARMYVRKEFSNES